ncbi:energy-coupling factor transporter transmembrane protein EcfT [Bacillaceae bacterium]
MSMLSNIPLGQYVPGTSFVHRLDPRAKIMFVFVYIFIIFLANNPASYALLLAFSLLAIAASRVPLRFVLRGLKPVWLLLVFTVILHLWTTTGGDVVWQWGMITIYEKGLEQAVYMSLRLLFLLLITSLLTLTTSPLDLTDGLERLFKPLEKVGFPAHELALMMSIALRFIPTLLEETEKIMKAQMARGADFESGHLGKRIKNLLPLLVPLFVSAFRRAEELALAMEARCYRGGKHRTRLKQLKYTRRDGLLALLSLLLAAALSWLRA